METHIATKKEHRCSACGRKIPLGARYFYDNGIIEHTNCLDYANQPMLELFFNQNRKSVEMKYAPHDKVDSFGRLIED